MLGAMESVRQFGRTLHDLIESLSRAKAGAAFLERQVVNRAIGLIGEGSGGRLLFRSQVLAVDFRGTQAGLRIGFEIIKLARLGKVDVAHELPPIVRSEAIQHAEDFVVVLQPQMASQVDAAIPESASDGALLGGKFEEKRAAAIGRSGVLLY